MTPRKLHQLLNTAASAAHSDACEAPASLAQRVWERIEQGWDPELIEWQRWMRCLAPWAGLLVILISLTVALLPHGSHEVAVPPSLSLFAQPAGKFEVAPEP